MFDSQAFGLAGLGDYGDLDWLTSELENIKQSAGRTGNVDGSKQLAFKAFTMFKPKSQGEVAQANILLSQANAYIESFRQGSGQLATASGNATGAVQSYNVSQESRYAQERDAETRSLAAAKSSWLGRAGYELGLEEAGASIQHTAEDVFDKGKKALDAVGGSWKLVGGLVVGGVVLFYFGDFIKAGGKVVRKVTG